LNVRSVYQNLDVKVALMDILKQFMNIKSHLYVKYVHQNLDLQVALTNTLKQCMKIKNLLNATCAL
jgi:hypothetical protein